MPRAAALYRIAFPQVLYGNYLAELQRQLRGATSCLDVGCGSGSPLRHLAAGRKVGVDGHAPSLEAARAAGTHDDYRLARVEDLGSLFPAKSFDCCVALDLIEHLPREGGEVLLEDLERIARHRVILFTPNGFLPQQSADGDLQEHLSGWTPGDFQAKGYRVFGMHGDRGLRGEYHQLRFRPHSVAGILSWLTQVSYIRSHPTRAAALLAVKVLG
jgi:SAM-dependent methyltransferase